MVRVIKGGQVPPRLRGLIPIPASKSQTVRALLIAGMAPGESRLRGPLESQDSLSCRRAIEAWGARVRQEGEDWLVQGIGGAPSTESTINVGNSGTTLYLATALAALGRDKIRFDGDDQIQKRSAENLLSALEGLGAKVMREGPGGCAPFTVQGPLRGGAIHLESPVSQYLSALLLAAPLAGGASPGDKPPVSDITVSLLNEAPYVEMTLDWLEKQEIQLEREDLRRFRVPGGQSYQPFDSPISGDWSSAGFFLAAAAVTGSTLTLSGLDEKDPQGDKAVADMLQTMGCRIKTTPEGIQIQGRPLSGAVLDLNATPDALPLLAVTACFAQGETRLENVPQARMKETDRIAVMAAELGAMGASVKELPHGLVINGSGWAPGKPSPLQGLPVDGRRDHRVVMALAVAALGARGQTSIAGAEAADVTFPGFFDLLDKALSPAEGGDILV